MSGEEGIIVIQVPLKLRCDAVPNLCGILGSSHGLHAGQSVVAVAEGHKISGVFKFHVRVDRAGQKCGKIGIPFRGDAHPVRHLVAHGEGQQHIRDLGIHRCLAGETEGHAGDAHGGIQVCPAQFLNGKGGACKNGVGVIVNQILKALTGALGQNVEGSVFHGSAAVPADLLAENVGLVPVIFGGFRQFINGILGRLHTDVFRQGTGVIIQAPDHGMQQIHQRQGGQYPAAPGDDALFGGDHSHKAGKDHHRQRHCQQLPQQKIHTGGPLGQNVLQCADHIGIDHIDDGGEPLAKLHQHPGQAADDGGGEISEPVFQRKRLLKSLVKGNSFS